MNGISVHRPRGFSGEVHYAPPPRIVAQQLPHALRIHYAKTNAEARRVEAAWAKGDYSQFPGDLRMFPMMDRKIYGRLAQIQAAIVNCEEQIVTKSKNWNGCDAWLLGLFAKRETELAKLMAPAPT